MRHGGGEGGREGGRDIASLALFFLRSQVCGFIGVWWSLVGAVIGADQWRGGGWH